MAKPRFARHRTAMKRQDMSRPMRLALEAELIPPESSVFDYGCGLGADIAGLTKLGIRVGGWDPVHRPDGDRKPADLVNLGYVINVIEDPLERADVVRKAWKLARRVLVVSGRLESESRLNSEETYGDGVVTKLGTFQKLYDQNELREWITQTIGDAPIAAAPGVFLVFGDEEFKQSYLARRYRYRRSAPKIRKSDLLYEEHRDLLDTLIGFVADRGRMPSKPELSTTDELKRVFGSVKRAFAVVRRVTGTDQWDRIRVERYQELLTYFAMDRFGGRPRFSDLPDDLRIDVKDYFSSYRQATDLADRLLFTAGNREKVDAAMRESEVGKLTGNALYLHVDAMHRLSPILRVYEACARNYLGVVEDANIVKLHRQKSGVSYLSYPDFDRNPHPPLVESTKADLQGLDFRYRDYRDRDNPPILHRKEEFIEPDDERYAKFSRLTQQEERKGLYENTSVIGTRDGWNSVLEAKDVILRGHRLVRSRTSK